MDSAVVRQTLAALEANLDTLAANLDGAVPHRIELLTQLEGVRRRATVISADLIAGLFREDRSELGGPAHQVIANWLRISPAEARHRNRQAEPLMPRTTLTGQPLPPHQPATAEVWRAGLLDGEHVRVIQKFLDDLPTDIDDLTFACKPHHRLIKPGGWTTQKLPNGQTQWIPPPGNPERGGTNYYHHPERLLGDY